MLDIHHLHIIEKQMQGQCLCSEEQTMSIPWSFENKKQIR